MSGNRRVSRTLVSTLDKALASILAFSPTLHHFNGFITEYNEFKTEEL